MKTAENVSDTLFMFEPKQCDLDLYLLFAKCINKIEDKTFRITKANLSNKPIILTQKSEY